VVFRRSGSLKSSDLKGCRGFQIKECTEGEIIHYFEGRPGELQDGFVLSGVKCKAEWRGYRTWEGGNPPISTFLVITKWLLCCLHGGFTGTVSLGPECSLLSVKGMLKLTDYMEREN
jgi:hypothetical protein